MLAGDQAITPELEFWVLWLLPIERLGSYRLARALANDHWCVPLEPEKPVTASPMLFDETPSDFQY